MRQLIDKKALSAKVPYHPEHCMRLARQGKFPRPIKLGDHVNARVAWDEAEVERWIEERIASRAPA